MYAQIKQDMMMIVRELAEAAGLRAGSVLVIGTSTSEVQGERIGTSGGSADIAQAIFDAVAHVSASYGFDPVYQCCEHLNRALVMERNVLRRLQLTEVSAVPVPSAGGSMAACAYGQFRQPCLAEHVQADAGIDIGDTFIGMHLRPVAVPVRPSIKQLGKAHVTMARTRPKLIGGARAVYEKPATDETC